MKGEIKEKAQIAALEVVDSVFDDLMVPLAKLIIKTARDEISKRISV